MRNGTEIRVSFCPKHRIKAGIDPSQLGDSRTRVFHCLCFCLMGIFYKGQFFLLLVISCAALARGDAVPVEGGDGRAGLSEGFDGTCGQDRVLVRKLEEIVRDLGDVVSRLESKVREIDGVAAVGHDGSNCDKVGSESYGVPVREGSLVGRKGCGDEDVIQEVVGGGVYEDKVRDRGGEGARGVSVTKFSPFWSEKFRFASAMRLDYEATCINVLPYKDYEGLSKYIAIGDMVGRFYVLSRNGDVLVGQDMIPGSAVTAMVSYISAFKNESIIVTGHEDGELLMHKVWELSSGEEWTSISMKSMGKFTKGGGGSEGVASINILEVQHVGRVRYILSTDSAGRIKVFREDGSLHGSFMPSSHPLAFLKQRPLFLTETGAGSLDLRSMKLKESDCEGLDESIARTYVFDVTERSKAYGYTSDGDLVHVVLLGDVGNFKCRVRFKKKLDMEEPMAFQAIKGYLLIVNSEKVSLFNVSTQHYTRASTPRQIFSANLDEIRSSFLNHHQISSNAEGVKTIPLVASDREKLVALSLGRGFIGVYQSNLPIYKSESNTMLWTTSPVLFFILFLFASWQFFTKKKEVLTSWGPDDPFTSASAISNPPLGGNARDRSLADSSSRNDGIDLRDTGRRPLARRYGSPTRYPTGTTTAALRTGTADTISRPTAESNFRTTSELKYRGAPLEPPGFPKRRESIFASNQAAEDSS
ncbi:hypothetical protein MLD38_002091 [Melastoma candidum]|uniref:Uncharacterized protein n=1 Tax=Melastoma candidum TaxID=119954 RepID=A0ACB9SFG1_9MYRT|nr:hypothetical protein MLD38_002091 [Melastoma candidum]